MVDMIEVPTVGAYDEVTLSSTFSKERGRRVFFSLIEAEITQKGTTMTNSMGIQKGNASGQKVSLTWTNSPYLFALLCGCRSLLVSFRQFTLS